MAVEGKYRTDNRWSAHAPAGCDVSFWWFMEITFWGAVQTVTGSMHLVEANGHRLLLDCGMAQGRRQEANKLNSEFPFDVKGIDAVVLSHAHLDHSGKLPLLVKNGFAGKIYATDATADIAKLIMMDSAKIQAEDTAYLIRHQIPGAEGALPLPSFPGRKTNTASVFAAAVFNSAKVPIVVPTVASSSAATAAGVPAPSAGCVATGFTNPAVAACAEPLSLLSMPRTTSTPAAASTSTPNTHRALHGFAAVPHPHPGPQHAALSCFIGSVFSGCCLPSSFVIFIVHFLFVFPFDSSPTRNTRCRSNSPPPSAP